MKKQITHISTMQTAKVISFLYLFFSLPFVAVMALSIWFSPGPKPGFGFLILMPFLYMLIGFIFTALGAWLYNQIAARIGGIEFTSVEK